MPSIPEITEVLLVLIGLILIVAALVRKTGIWIDPKLARRVMSGVIGGLLLALGFWLGARGNLRRVPSPVSFPQEERFNGYLSTDGKYKASLVGSIQDRHYQISEVGSNRLILTTRSQYSRPNNVKAGMFSPGSQEFAAAYHYGHAGGYTWVGVWDLETGNLLREEKRSGYITNISWVFSK